MKKIAVKIFRAFGVDNQLIVLDNENNLWGYVRDSQIWYRIPPPMIEIPDPEEDGEEHA